jgi:hypothetical protein
VEPDVPIGLSLAMRKCFRDRTQLDEDIELTTELWLLERGAFPKKTGDATNMAHRPSPFYL